MPSDHDTIGPVQPKRLASSLLAENGVEDVTSALQDLEAFATLTTNLEGVSVALRNLCIRTTVINSLHGVADVLDERTQTLFADTAAFNELLGPLIQEIEQGDGTIEPALLEDIEAKYHEVLSRPTYRMYFAGLLLDALDTDDPEAIHYATVDRIIDTDALPDDGLDKARDALARELCNACRGLAKTAHIFRRTTFEDQIPDNGLPRAEFDAPLASHDESGRIYAGSRSTGEMNLDTAEGNAPMPKFAAGAAGEMLWLDAAGIAWAEHGFAAHPKEGSADKERSASEGPFGSAHSKPLEAMVEDARSRWEQYGDNPSPELLKWWADPDEDIPTHIPLVDLACEHFWEDKIRPEWERQKSKQPATMTGIRFGERQDTFAKVEKTVGAVPTKGRLARQSGNETQPVHVEDASDFEIDDERFTRAPGVLRIIPQNWGVTPHQNDPRPADMQMPLGIDPEAGASVALRVLADSQVQLAPKAAKVAVGLHLLSPPRGLGYVELGELAEFINQGRSRPAQKREREKIRNNLVAVRSLGVPERLDGTGRNIQMFEIHVPDNLDKEAKIVFGYTRGYEQFLGGISDNSGPLRKLNGRFIVNADGFMRISGNDSDSARMYLTLCSMWNDANWDPDRVPFHTPDTLARRANQLSEQARRALEGGSNNTNQLRQGRRATKRAIEKLIDGYDLAADLKLKGRGGSQGLKILPNERHREAYEHLRNNRDRDIPLDDS